MGVECVEWLNGLDGVSPSLLMSVVCPWCVWMVFSPPQSAFRKVQDAMPGGVLTRDFLAQLFHGAKGSVVPLVRELYMDPTVAAVESTGDGGSGGGGEEGAGGVVNGGGSDETAFLQQRLVARWKESAENQLEERDQTLGAREDASSKALNATSRSKGKGGSTQVSRGLYCPRCGFDIANGDKFCGKCGARQN